jgi:hypothetical protein
MVLGGDGISECFVHIRDALVCERRARFDLERLLVVDASLFERLAGAERVGQVDAGEEIAWMRRDGLPVRGKGRAAKAGVIQQRTQVYERAQMRRVLREDLHIEFTRFFIAPGAVRCERVGKAHFVRSLQSIREEPKQASV